ncbi:putative pituitary tumor-transforming gene 3 protein [Thomomys bottae]
MEGLKLESRPVKASDGRIQVSISWDGKVFSAPLALSETARKALGMVNRATEKPGKTNEPIQQKQLNFTVKKMTEKTESIKLCPCLEDAYPEIEKCFPFNPVDFQSFDLLVEHQIAHLPPIGVPLLVLEEKQGLGTLLQLGSLSLIKKPGPA